MTPSCGTSPSCAPTGPELVLRFGGGLTPKVPQTWLDGSGAEVVLFSDEGALYDANHRAAHVVEGSATSACAQLAEGLSRGMGPWARDFLGAEQWARATLESAFTEDTSLTEMRIAHEVVAALPEGAQLFVSSSMPIRDVDAFAPTMRKRLRVLANRGRQWHRPASCRVRSRWRRPRDGPRCCSRGIWRCCMTWAGCSRRTAAGCP